MSNPFLKAQCQNMIAMTTAFSQACEFAALDDDGRVTREEAKKLKKIRAAAERFQLELQQTI